MRSNSCVTMDRCVSAESLAGMFSVCVQGLFSPSAPVNVTRVLSEAGMTRMMPGSMSLGLDSLRQHRKSQYPGNGKGG